MKTALAPDVVHEIVAAIVPFELLKPPLYYKDWRGNKMRIWTPPAEERCRVRAVVYARDDFTCQECGQEFDHPDDYDGLRNIDGLTLGHLVDYRWGGPFIEENLQAECRECNLGSAHMTPKGSPTRTRETGRGDGVWGEFA